MIAACYSFHLNGDFWVFEYNCTSLFYLDILESWIMRKKVLDAKQVKAPLELALNLM